MADQEFEGISKNGTLEDALEDAIQNAKNTLITDYVSWELVNLKGINGGWAQVNEIHVTISANGPS